MIYIYICLCFIRRYGANSKKKEYSTTAFADTLLLNTVFICIKRMNLYVLNSITQYLNVHFQTQLFTQDTLNFLHKLNFLHWDLYHPSEP